jgi:hypothetical protein
MLVLILTALVVLIYGIYRGAGRWGLAVLWYVAAAASALDASGVVAERLWGPRYSWNFAHHGTRSQRPSSPYLSPLEWRFGSATVICRAYADGFGVCSFRNCYSVGTS